MDDTNRAAFMKWLLTEKSGRQSCMIGRSQGEKIIQYLREKREKGEDDPQLRSKFEPAFRISIKKRGFKLVNAFGLGDILCLPIKKNAKHSTENHAMLGQNRQVIFKEDMFDVIQNAHKTGAQHRGYKGTFKKINETYCSIPREVVYKFVELCGFCAFHHACYTRKHHRESKEGANSGRKIKKIKKRIELPDAFLTRCQIDIINMTKDPDGSSFYIGHFFDHHTKYNVLFPLKKTEAVFVAKKLCRHVFGHFGLPRILYSNMSRDFIDELISWIVHFWSTDVPIINGNPENKKVLPLIQQRQKTMMILIETIRSRQGDSNAWSSWLPGIQYSLNTNEFELDCPPSYETVFKSHPRCYSYSVSNTHVLREEDMFQSDEEEDVDDRPLVNEGSTSEECVQESAFASSSPDNSSQIFSMAVPETIMPLSMVPSKTEISKEMFHDSSENAISHEQELNCTVQIADKSKSLGIIPPPTENEQEDGKEKCVD